jgi:hypothetical protein
MRPQAGILLCWGAAGQQLDVALGKPCIEAPARVFCPLGWVYGVCECEN